MQVFFCQHVLIFQSSMKNRNSDNLNILHLLPCALLLLISVQMNGQNTLLYGKAVDYSSKEISFYTISDPILHQKSELATTTVSGDGNFSVLISPANTIEIYTDLEKYCGTMVIEPNKNYQITLPPFSPRSVAEARSVYFKPTLYWLGLPGTGNSDLNFAVRSFLTDYNLEMVKNTAQIYQQKSKVILTEIMDRLDKKYESYKLPYFKTLKKFTFSELEYIVNQNNAGYVIKKYFASQPIELNNPAYQKAFETIFTDFLRKESQDIKNQKLVGLTNEGKYNELVAFFKERGYSEEFAELAVLKGLNDGYYTGIFTKEGVLKAIETARSEAKQTEIQMIANQVKRKLTFLSIGGKAPSFRLSDQNGEPVTLDQFRGKYVYLNFINSKSPDCKREIEALIPLERKLKQLLTVLSISLDDDYYKATTLWKSKGCSWKIVDGAKQKQLIKEYNAFVTPAFFLISPDGTLRLSQAPSPTHDFETIFLKIIRN